MDTKEVKEALKPVFDRRYERAVLTFKWVNWHYRLEEIELLGRDGEARISLTLWAESLGITEALSLNVNDNSLNGIERVKINLDSFSDLDVLRAALILSKRETLSIDAYTHNYKQREDTGVVVESVYFKPIIGTGHKNRVTWPIYMSLEVQRIIWSSFSSEKLITGTD